MNAYKFEAVVTENGTVTLQGLPFQAGDRVEVIVLEQSLTPQQESSARDRIAADQEYLHSIESQMSEWTSVEDEAAYHDV